MILLHRTSKSQYFLGDFNDFASPGQPSPAQPGQLSQPSQPSQLAPKVPHQLPAQKPIRKSMKINGSSRHAGV